MMTVPDDACKDIATIDSTLLANLGLLPFAKKESAPMPVIVSVRTIGRVTQDALEFVTSPQGPVVQVAAWLTFFDKFACIKNTVVGLEP
jgi:hypothetical protein